MATLESIAPRVMVMVPDAPQPYVEMAILDAATEFCRESLFLRERLDQTTVSAGEGEYIITPESGSGRIIRVFDAWIDGRRLEPLSAYDLSKSDWTTQSAPVVHGYTMLSENVMRLYPIPEAGGELTGWVATAPNRNATSINDVLANRWLDALVFGAVARVMTSPVVGGDKSGASTYRAMFNNEIQKARIEVNVGQTTKELTVRPRAFGG